MDDVNGNGWGMRFFQTGHHGTVRGDQSWQCRVGYGHGDFAPRGGEGGGGKCVGVHNDDGER